MCSTMGTRLTDSKNSTASRTASGEVRSPATISTSGHHVRRVEGVADHQAGGVPHPRAHVVGVEGGGGGEDQRPGRRRLVDPLEQLLLELQVLRRVLDDDVGVSDRALEVRLELQPFGEARRVGRALGQVGREQFEGFRDDARRVRSAAVDPYPQAVAEEQGDPAQADGAGTDDGDRAEPGVGGLGVLRAVVAHARPAFSLR